VHQGCGVFTFQSNITINDEKEKAARGSSKYEFFVEMTTVEDRGTTAGRFNYWQNL
jgi:hypothetical protein